jgi:hypothetical protein
LKWFCWAALAALRRFLLLQEDFPVGKGVNERQSFLFMFFCGESAVSRDCRSSLSLFVAPSQMEGRQAAREEESSLLSFRLCSGNDAVIHASLCSANPAICS